jgi:hypothetical protein
VAADEEEGRIRRNRGVICAACDNQVAMSVHELAEGLQGLVRWHRHLRQDRRHEDDRAHDLLHPVPATPGVGYVGRAEGLTSGGRSQQPKISSPLPSVLCRQQMYLG